MRLSGAFGGAFRPGAAVITTSHVRQISGQENKLPDYMVMWEQSVNREQKNSQIAAQIQANRVTQVSRPGFRCQRVEREQSEES